MGWTGWPWEMRTSSKDGEERWRVSDNLADVLEGRNCPIGRGVVVGVAKQISENLTFKSKGV